MSSNRLILFSFLVVISSMCVAALPASLSDQGSGATYNGVVLGTGNLTISIWTDPTSTSSSYLVFNQTYLGAITNGSWNIMLNDSVLNLEFGKKYYKDYAINGQDLDFGTDERLPFYSTVGAIDLASDSITIGDSSLASGAHSIAFGIGANASGIVSIAIGEYSASSGGNSIAIGPGSSANYSNSVAIGVVAAAHANNQFAVGSGSIPLNTLIYGTLNTTGNIYENNARVCTVANGLCADNGTNLSGSGTNSIAIGVGSVATGNNSIAIGYGAYATYANSAAIGTNTGPWAANQFIIGRASIPLNVLVFGSFNTTGNLYENNARVCTAANGLCASGESNSGWMNTSTMTSTALTVNITHLIMTSSNKPGSPLEGTIYYDASIHKPCYYNSTDWVTFSGESC